MDALAAESQPQPPPAVSAPFTLDRVQLTRGLVLLAALIPVRYAVAWTWAKAFGMGYPARLDFAAFVLGVFLVVSVGLVGFGASRWAGIDLGRLWRGDRRLGRDLLAAFAGLVALMAVLGASSFAMVRLGVVPMPTPVRPPDAGAIAFQAIGALFFGFFIASFSEETLFRGVLQTGLRQRMPPWAAIVVQAAVFSLSHVGMEPVVSAAQVLMLAAFRFLAGLVLGILFEKRGSLRAGGIAHGIVG